MGREAPSPVSADRAQSACLSPAARDQQRSPKPSLGTGSQNEEAPRGLERGEPCLDYTQGGSRVLRLKVLCVCLERKEQ